MSSSPLILAVDTDDLDIAKRWVATTSEYIGVFKLGLEFFLKFGISGVQAIKSETDKDLFLDLKLHDIPNTVAKSAAQLREIDPLFLTVHASGGKEMIGAASKALPNTKITAVTILTSLDSFDLNEIGFIGTSQQRAAEMAKFASAAGARAIVCSPQEIASVRQVIPTDVQIITPGVRPLSSTSSDDQKRTMDPKSAIVAGANYLVIGRPITQAEHMLRAAKEIFTEVMN
ncbi:MAG: orotidine-5'-phosphate decarboxylase [Candidatus Nanopelagicaceae bacterium]|jgi:orotidine-5'-phosphate decarboxylase